MKETNRDEYTKKCHEWADRAKYPVYGEWCKETVLNVIRRYGISGDKKYLEKVFNSNSDLCKDLSDADISTMLKEVGCSDSNIDMVCTLIWDEFSSKYYGLLFEMNPEMAKEDPDALMDISNDGEEINLDLLEKAFEEIGMNELKEIFLDEK